MWEQARRGVITHLHPSAAPYCLLPNITFSSLLRPLPTLLRVFCQLLHSMDSLSMATAARIAQRPRTPRTLHTITPTRPPPLTIHLLSDPISPLPRPLYTCTRPLPLLLIHSLRSSHQPSSAACQHRPHRPHRPLRPCHTRLLHLCPAPSPHRHSSRAPARSSSIVV